MKKQKPKRHYLDGEKFTKESILYRNECQKVINETPENEEVVLPIISDYIAISIMKLCENLSLSPNFIGYTYRDEMIMDAVEDCLKATTKFDPDAYTKSGKPNAFGYYTQTAFYAMVRRIQKEKKVQALKEKILQTATPYDFVDDADQDASFYINNLLNMAIKDH